MFLRTLMTSALGALFLCLSVTRGLAQSDLAALSLESVGTRAVEQSPRVRMALASLEAARAYRAFGTMPRVGNPILNLRAMVGRPDQSAATYSVTLGLPFDVSGRRRAYRNEATWVEREAEAHLAVAQNEARAEAREAFVDAALGAELERVARSNAEVAHDFFARVKARFDAKAATALDVALSQRDAAESAAAVAHTRGVLVEARGRLRQVLDLAPEAGLELSPLPPLQMPKDLSVERAIELALAQRRDVQALTAAAERTRAADERLRRDVIAPLVVSGDYEAQANKNTQTTGGVGISSELPVVLRNQAERAQMKAQGSVFALESELTKRRVAREAMNTFLLLEAALLELAAIEGEATPAAEQALAMTNEMLEAGAIDYFRLLNARESAFLLRARRVETLRAAWHQRIELERALGGLSEAP
jgi:outer membrane protein, heavy metal efflux system